MERALYKSGGEWNVDNVTWIIVRADKTFFTVDSTSGVTDNAGTFTFEKKEVGELNFTVDGELFSYQFGWSISQDQVYITEQSSTNPLSVFQDERTISYAGEHGDEYMTITGTDVAYDYIDNVTMSLTATIVLSR